MTAALIGAAIVYLAASPTAAFLIGRSIKLRDTHETPPRGVTPDTAPRRAHLRSVR